MFHCCLACAASCTSLEAGAESLAFMEAISTAVQPQRSPWSSLVEAGRGSHQDANAVATVGLTESMLSLVFAVGMGLSLSTTAMVARRIGEKDPEGAAVAAVQAIALGLIVSLAIGLPCLLLAPRLLHLMGASPEIVSVGSGYTRICLGGSCAVLLLFLNNAIFRGAGDAAIVMRLLWVSNII